MNDGTLLEVRSLTKRFGGLAALGDLELTIGRGEIVSVIGPNGAGKTTLFNAITGLYPPDEGEIWFDGHNIGGLKANQITKLGIARTFQTVHLFPNMTVLENAMVGQHCRTKAGVTAAILVPLIRHPWWGLGLLPWLLRRFVVGRFMTDAHAEEEQIREKARRALSVFGSRLAGYRHDQTAASLSYANRRRLEIARALSTEPKLLLLDEPTAGMNPIETDEMTSLVGEIRDQFDVSVIVIEHDMKVVKGVSDRVVALDYGSKIAEGTYDEVATNDRVIEAYLGKKTVAEA